MSLNILIMSSTHKQAQTGSSMGVTSCACIAKKEYMWEMNIHCVTGGAILQQVLYLLRK